MLAESQAFEIEVALDAFDRGSADMDALHAKVSARCEQSFVDAHRSELEAFKSS